MPSLIRVNLDFCNNTILSCFFFFFFIIDFYFLIPAVIVQIFIPIAEPITPTEIATNEAVQKSKYNQYLLKVK